MPSIRQQYEQCGVDSYYLEHGGGYENPHAQDVVKCLRYFYSKEKHMKVLDFACGDGLVSKRIGNQSKIIGCDGYLYERYTKETGNRCHKHTFQDICDFNNFIENNFDLIVFSYAIDLVESSYIQQLLYRLSTIGKEMLVIRPNKHIIDSPLWSIKEKYNADKSKSALYISLFNQNI
jgi:ubiquinone/menaquinone biosynthesis C-methylase UbiE